MKFLAVTTFNFAGLELYGRRMVETFDRHWPVDVPLRVYAEGWHGVGEVCRGATTVDLLAASPWLGAFKARHAGRPKPLDYRLDAVRFAHKVAAICHAAREPDAEIVIWIDGDVVTHADIGLADLAALAPVGEEWIAWLDRTVMYPETGFLMLNCRHPEHARLVAALEAMYAQDLLFALPAWTDCHAIEHVVKTAGVAAKSLSGDARGHPHPLVNGPLGTWFDHLKGGRKRLGRSRPTDLRGARAEEYWR